MTLNKIFAIVTIAGFAYQAQAAFGEIDLIVRQSIKNDFQDYRRLVDITSLQYRGEPKVAGNEMYIESSVYGESGFNKKWGYHYCTTKIEILAPGRYKDQGTRCQYSIE